MDNKDTFASGFYYKAPNEKAPSWIDGRIVVNIADFGKWYTEWVAANPDKPWLSFDLKTSKDGKKYAQINTFEKVGMEKPKEEQPPETVIDFIPRDQVDENSPF